MRAVVPGAPGKAYRSHGLIRPSARPAALSKWCDTDGSLLHFIAGSWADMSARWFLCGCVATGLSARAQVATRYDKLAAGCRATVMVADIVAWLRARPDRAHDDPGNAP